MRGVSPSQDSAGPCERREFCGSAERIAQPTASGRIGRLPTVIDKGVNLLKTLDVPLSGELIQLIELGRRLTQGRFHLAVLGQFKRGKSTFLNALLGEEVLPTSVVPLTAIPTFLHSATSCRAEIHFEDGRPAEHVEANDAAELLEFLARFVTEQANPQNRLKVRHVEVGYPADILQCGGVLIDTPGIGSTLRHNTAATLNFLPQCDAAVFLVSADPPITEVEIDFLRQVRGKVPRLFLVFNKVDYLSPAEIPIALAFFKDVLREQAGIDSDLNVFSVSARRGLEAQRTGCSSTWEESGMAGVEKHLLGFLANEKTAALESAVAAKAANVLNHCLLRVELAVKAFEMPLAELQARQAEFYRIVQDAECQQVVAQDLLAGERRRAIERLESHAGRLRIQTRGELRRLVKHHFDTAGEEPTELLVQEELAAVIPSLFEQELGTTAADFAQYLTELLEPHRRRLEDLVEQVGKNAADLFDIPYQPLHVGEAFVLGEEPYWETHTWQAHLGPISPERLDLVLPARFRRARIIKRLMCQVDRLVMHNVENLRWPTLQSLDATFRRFSEELRERFAKTIAATYGAIQTTVRRRQQHAAVATGEIDRLNGTAERLHEMLAELEPWL